MYKNFFYLIAVLLITISCSSGNEKDSIPSNEINTSYEPQLNFLNKAIEDDPENGDLYFKRARVYNKMFLFKLAVADIDLAIKFEPDKSEYYSLLAEILFNNNDVFGAIKAAERAEGLGSTDSNLKVLMARLYWAIKDTVRVDQYLKKANSLVPFHSDLALLEGLIRADKHDTSGALILFRNAVRRDKSNIKPYRELVKVYDALRKEDTLMYFLIKGREIKPNDAVLFFYEGKFLQRKDLSSSAKLAYQSALKYDSAYYQTYYQLGYMDYRNADFTNAYKNFNAYIKYNNEDVNIYKKLIEISQRQGNDAATIPYYERLTVLDSNNVGVKYILERLYKLYGSGKVPEIKIKDSVALKRTIVSSNPDTSKRRLIQPLQRKKMEDSLVIKETKQDTSALKK